MCPACMWARSVTPNRTPGFSLIKLKSLPNQHEEDEMTAFPQPSEMSNSEIPEGSRGRGLAVYFLSLQEQG